jgi:hypothetical protein
MTNPRINQKTFKIRQDIIHIHYRSCDATQHTNNDEKNYDEDSKYPFAGSFTKSFSHDIDTGLVDKQGSHSFQDLVHAFKTGDKRDFAQIKLSDRNINKLVDPQAALYITLVGESQSCIESIIPPKLESKEHAVEMIELYAMELTRDIPFIDWNDDTSIINILEYLNDKEVIEHFNGPIENGSINIRNLFRGNTYDSNTGPYISQLLYYDIPYGSQTVKQKYKCGKPRKSFDQNNLPKTGSPVDFGVTKESMIAIQHGRTDHVFNISEERFGPDKYIYSPRCLAEVVHNDALYHHYYNAAQILVKLECPVDGGFKTLKNDSPYTSMGAPHDIFHHVANIAGIALKHAWYHKWVIHRRLRPEASSLRVQSQKENRRSKFLDKLIFDNGILDLVEEMHKDYYGVKDSVLLSSVYPEGSPCHPSYPSGHAVVAGACVTLLKIFFDGHLKWCDLREPVYQANFDGSNLVNYNGSCNNMTVNTELNKLGWNIALGRNWANVHYRSDGDLGMLIGEEIAIQYMSDTLSCYNQTDYKTSLTLEKFDGSKTHIERTL